MKTECNKLALFLPPDSTGYVQLIDDNCGKHLRGLINNKYDDWVEAQENFKITASDIRIKLIGWLAEAAVEWNDRLATTIGE